MLDLAMVAIILGSLYCVGLLIRWCFFQVEADEE